MALVKCPECAREISQEAFACPGCGKPLRNPLRVAGKGFLKYAVVTWALLIVAFFLVFKLFVQPQHPPRRGVDRGTATP
jgi:hypothetical protein